MGILSQAKDRVVEYAALTYLNAKLLAPYGEATELRIDSSARKIFIRVALKGETTPIDVEINDYSIRQDGERYFATLKSVSTSREWITTLAKERLLQTAIEIPPSVGRVLKHMI